MCADSLRTKSKDPNWKGVFGEGGGGEGGGWVVMSRERGSLDVTLSTSRETILL